MNIFLKEFYEKNLIKRMCERKGKYEKGGKVIMHALFHKWMILIMCGLI